MKHKFSIAIKPYYGKLFLNNSLFRIGSGDNYFFNMDKILSKKGIKIETIDKFNDRNTDVYLFCDIPYPWELDNWLTLLKHKKQSVLMTFESPLVNPFSHMKTLQRLFSRVYTWDSNITSGNKINKFLIPQMENGINTEIIPFSKRKFLTFINSNKKVPFIFKMLSGRPDLYKERIKSIKYFQINHKDKFDFYGKGWKKSNNLFTDQTGMPLCYKGEPEDKFTILSQYKYCLCFENTIAPGYVTEKIFDCMKAGAVPIYWGAPNIEKFIPKSCFIDKRNYKSYEELYSYLSSISQKEFDSYMTAISKFLKSEFKNVWSQESFVNTLLSLSKIQTGKV
ncbi:glycosyltransferase family 10 domain-containing protein [Patescibacteria group bacterium]